MTPIEVSRLGSPGGPKPSNHQETGPAAGAMVLWRGMVFRPSVGWRPREPVPALTFVLVLVLGPVLAMSACRHPQPCQDPTREGVCFCPIGVSCHHECGQGTGHCTLGCSQGNPSCSVSCADDCTALCGGAGRCDAVCGDHCNVSCEWVKEKCTAQVGPWSRVNCEGAADCDVRCDGSCDVSCPNGHCRVHCAHQAGCDLNCGGAGATLPPIVCPDGSLVCGRPC